MFPSVIQAGAKNMNFKHPALLSTAFIVLLLSSALCVVSTEPALANKIKNPESIGLDPELETALKHHFEKRWFCLISATDEQQSVLSDILDRQVEQARPIRQKVRDQLLNLTDLMAGNSASDQEIKDKIEEIKGLRDQLSEMRVNTILKMRAELTSEQRRLMAQRAKGFLSGNLRLGLLR